MKYVFFLIFVFLPLHAHALGEAIEINKSGPYSYEAKFSSKKYDYLIAWEESSKKCGSGGCEVDIFDITNHKSKKITSIWSSSYFYHLRCPQRDALIYSTNIDKQTGNVDYKKWFLGTNPKNAKEYKILATRELIELGPNKNWAELKKCE